MKAVSTLLPHGPGGGPIHTTKIVRRAVESGSKCADFAECSVYPVQWRRLGKMGKSLVLEQADGLIPGDPVGAAQAEQLD